MPKPRPFINWGRGDLENFANKNWNNPDPLQSLLDELHYRRRPAARVLREQIEERLKTLRGNVDSRSRMWEPIIETDALLMLGYRPDLNDPSVRRTILEAAYSLPRARMPEGWGDARSATRRLMILDSLTVRYAAAKKTANKTGQTNIRDDLNYVQEEFFE